MRYNMPIRRSKLQRLLAIVLFISALVYWFAPIPQYRYNLAVCGFFKNEAPWLKEWITYHHDVLGFNHFYLYNNDSTDNYEEILRPFIKQGIVELIDWSSSDESHKTTVVNDTPVPWHLFQIGAYNNCMKRALGKAKWVAVIDIDEFIVPVNGVSSFKALVHDAEKRRKGSIKFSWRMFGTSHVDELQPGELLTEKLTWRGADDNYAHNYGKCMHRPEAVNFCHIHDACKLNPGFRFKHAKPDAFRIHHYWTRTEKFCLEKRGKSEVAESYNVVQDRTMDQYIPKVKKALSN